MYLTALDFGSSKVKGAVAEMKKDGSLLIIKTIRRDSAGVKKGEITHPDEAVRVLFEILSELKHFDKRCLKNLIFGISGANSRFYLSRAAISIPRPDLEIISEDVDRVLKESLAVNLPAGWQIIHTIPREFFVDDIEVNKESVIGLSGKKLEATAVLVTVFSSIYRNFLKVITLVLGKKGDFDGSIIFSPLASERVLLSKSQRELGVVMIDIGFGTTSMIVYDEGKLLSVKVFPIGSGSITNDLAIGLKCSVPAAEKLKVVSGFAFAREVSSKEKIELSEYEDGQGAEVSRRFVAEIIEARLREIFSLVGEELKSMGKFGKLPAGAVLSGGGAKLPGIGDLARNELKLPIQVGFPRLEEFEISNAHVADEISDPDMAVACGLILSRADMVRKGGSFGFSSGASYNLNEPWWKRLIKALLVSD